MAVFEKEKIVRVTFKATDTGNANSFSLCYASNTNVIYGDGQEVADAWVTAMSGVLQAVMSSEVKFQGVYVTGIVPNVTRPGVKLYDNISGGVSGESLPQTLAAIIQLRQAEVSSRHNGHIALFGVPESWVTASLITGAHITTEFAALAAAMATPIVTGASQEWFPVILQRFNAGAPFGPFGLQVNQVLPTRSLGTQRRRRTEFSAFHP